MKDKRGEIQCPNMLTNLTNVYNFTASVTTSYYFLFIESDTIYDFANDKGFVKTAGVISLIELVFVFVGCR